MFNEWLRPRAKKEKRSKAKNIHHEYLCSLSTTYPHEHQQPSAEGIPQGKAGSPNSSPASNHMEQGFESGSPPPAAGFLLSPLGSSFNLTCTLSFPPHLLSDILTHVHKLVHKKTDLKLSAFANWKCLSKVSPPVPPVEELIITLCFILWSAYRTHFL